MCLRTDKHHAGYCNDLHYAIHRNSPARCRQTRYLVTGLPLYGGIYTHDIFPRNMSFARDMNIISDKAFQSAPSREKYR